MKNKLLSNPFKSIKNVVIRYSLTLFIIMIASGLIVCISILSNILANQPSSSDSTSDSTTTTTLDQTTTDRLNKMTTSNNSSSNQVLPSGRINPFSE